MLAARFRLRAVSSVKLAEACLKKLDRGSYTASLQGKLGSEATPNEVLAESIALFGNTFETQHSIY